MPGTRRNAAQPKGEAAATAGSQPAKQRQEPSQLLDQYRKEWQGNNTLSGNLLIKTWELLHWLECISGLYLFDYEEKLLVALAYLALVVLIGLGAYKQGRVLWDMLAAPLFK